MLTRGLLKGETLLKEGGRGGGVACEEDTNRLVVRLKQMHISNANFGILSPNDTFVPKWKTTL